MATPRSKIVDESVTPWLVDWTSRLARDGKAQIPDTVAPIFERIATKADDWRAMMAAMVSQANATGSHFGHEASMMAAARNDGKRWHRRSWLLFLLYIA
jgi:hypothetical protein